ncbi:MAG: glycoside hydrolase [Bryobacteraceae bacterium]|nr:glycoside hydrolase [Bryobacteraceae bacterium]
MAALSRRALLAAPALLRAARIRKTADIVIYSDDRFYSAFPSIARLPGGELIVAFRRAPERRLLGAKGVTHTDANSQLVLVRSRDGGRTWTREPELLFSHPLGGSQDPCLLALRDGTILCASYLWIRVGAEARGTVPATVWLGDYAFHGGYLLRSRDGGRTWQGPFPPPPVPGRSARDCYGGPLPACNRGAMCQTRDGTVHWAVAYPKGTDAASGTDVHWMTSANAGMSWQYRGVLATDSRVSFNETSLYETPSGALVAFVRTEGLDGRAAVVRCDPRTWRCGAWQDAGWRGHPLQAVRLEDGRALLVYGYRHPPYGVRARILNAECTDFAAAEEMVLRDDGGGTDLGYPWAAVLPGRRVLVVYYFQKENGTRHIAGTWLES